MDIAGRNRDVFRSVTQLIDDYPSDAKVKELVDKFDWYFLPVANPDGYNYTWSTVYQQHSLGAATS